MSKKGEGYAAFFNEIYSINGLADLFKGDSKIVEDVNSMVFSALDTFERRFSRNHPFVDEELRYKQYNALSDNEFLKRFEELKKDVESIDPTNELNLEEANNVIENGQSMDQERLGHKIAAFKKEVMDRWGGLLEAKKLAFFLKELDELRKDLVKLLYERIEKYKRLKDLLSPFSNELGRLWDLSKGNWSRVGFDVLEEYAKFLEKEKELKELAEFLGRMHEAEDELEEEEIKEMVIKPIVVVNHAGRSEFVGIHESADLSALLPQEVALLNDPIVEWLFYSKLAEKKLMTYQFIGWDYGTVEEERIKKEKKKKAEEKKGPIILCIDTSGSMHGYPEYVAKVLCFAMVRIALLETRKCFLISFSTGISTIELTNLNKNLKNLIEFLSMSFHGGTDATPALSESLRQLETKNYEKADVVMISDFVMGVPSKNVVKQIEQAKKKGTLFHSIAISTVGNPSALNIFDSQYIFSDSSKLKPILKAVRNIAKVRASKSQPDANSKSSVTPNVGS